MTNFQTPEGQAIEAKAKKDFEFYKGLELLVSKINIAPDGWIELGDRVPVRAIKYSHVDFNSPYIDATWEVELTEAAIAAIRRHMESGGYCDSYVQGFEARLASNSLDPYIRGFVYCEDETDRLIGYYRAWT